MSVCQSSKWASWFDGFTAPFVYVDPVGYGDQAASAGLTLGDLTVTDREWDFGSRSNFARWCSVGSTAWTDRIPVENREQFVENEVLEYEAVSGRPGLFRLTQMRAELHR